MDAYSLLNLRLHAPLRYAGVENPPFSGLGNGLPPGIEGEEEIFVFEAEDLVVFDPDEGPRVIVALPPPRFHGRLAAKEGGQGELWTLPSSTYLFMQWRPADLAELLSGIEWFAREAWWEGTPGEGPYIVRRLREDGKAATQLFRSLRPAD